MFKVVPTAVVLATVGTSVFAEGVERTSQSVGVLFEQGRYLEFGLAAVNPSISGEMIAAPVPSGDMTESYLNFGAAYKADLNDTWSYAIIYEQPHGADVAYPTGGAYPFAGAVATLRAHALTGILQYNMPSNVSLYGGLRAQTLEAEVSLPFLSAYTATGERDFELGYLVGAAYERPDIALRVSLTYNSEISHDLATTESTLGGSLSSTTEITTPQSLSFDFQSGIAEDTLLFGSVRWVDWTEFDITPTLYTTSVVPGESLVAFADDRITYTLGLGRRLNENWSIAGSVNYEKSTGSLTGNLGPKDGLLGASLAAVYRKDNMKITTGISYVDIGDATTRAFGAPFANFTDNHAVAAGVKVGFYF